MVEDQELEAAMARFAQHRTAFETALIECEMVLANNGLGLDRYARLKKMHEALMVERTALQARIKEALESL